MQFWITLVTCLVCVQTQDLGQEITLGIKHECEGGESQEVCHTTKRYHFVTIFKVNVTFLLSMNKIGLKDSISDNNIQKGQLFQSTSILSIA